MLYVSQIILLYTLDLDSAVCQLYLSITGREKYLIWRMNEWISK